MDTDFTELRACHIFEEAVDLTTCMQKQLREREAWVTMVCTMSASSFPDETALWAAEYPLMDDHYVGLFLNDTEEFKASWLMSRGIPVFIVHCYSADELCGSDERFSSGFLDGMETKAHKSPMSNGFTFIAARGHYATTSLEFNDGRARDLVDDVHEFRFSSSLSLEVRHKTRTNHVELLVPPPRTWVIPSQLLGPSSGIATSVVTPNQTASFQAPLLDLRKLDDTHMDWIMPPLVAAVCPNVKGGKWEMVSNSDSLDDILVKCTKSWNQEAENQVWYDHNNLWELYLDEDYTLPEGVVCDAVLEKPAV
ncbi:hypothetical protein C8R44DRAFT_729723 [Mycena epipterygia]|nr:hypothetical protein C8R44DRAFT_729723 [Mycena epipterygia]